MLSPPPPPPSFVRLYFVFFYVSGVLIILNLAVSFVLDAFLEVFSEHKAAHEGAQTEEDLDGTNVGTCSGALSLGGIEIFTSGL